VWTLDLPELTVSTRRDYLAISWIDRPPAEPVYAELRRRLGGVAAYRAVRLYPVAVFGAALLSGCQPPFHDQQFRATWQMLNRRDLRPDPFNDPSHDPGSGAGRHRRCAAHGGGWLGDGAAGTGTCGSRCRGLSTRTSSRPSAPPPSPDASPAYARETWADAGCTSNLPRSQRPSGRVARTRSPKTASACRRPSGAPHDVSAPNGCCGRNPTAGR
jgi:hypothetical protein